VLTLVHSCCIEQVSSGCKTDDIDRPPGPKLQASRGVLCTSAVAGNVARAVVGGVKPLSKELCL